MFKCKKLKENKFIFMHNTKLFNVYILKGSLLCIDSLKRWKCLFIKKLQRKS